MSIMALFSAIILFYTNSTFTKQRKREFAIYNILGMEKRHISYVLFWESLYTAAMALFFGLVAAGVFSKLLQLVLMRLIGGEATFGLNIRLMSIGYTVVFFGALFLLLLLNTIRIIHLSNPVQLLRAGSEGEREPRSKWILALLGAVCLAAGYIISLRTNVALYAIQNFFPAVILVIIGTYLTFIALSVVVLKALRSHLPHEPQRGRPCEHLHPLDDGACDGFDHGEPVQGAGRLRRRALAAGYDAHAHDRHPDEHGAGRRAGFAGGG